MTALVYSYRRSALFNPKATVPMVIAREKRMRFALKRFFVHLRCNRPRKFCQLPLLLFAPNTIN